MYKPSQGGAKNSRGCAYNCFCGYTNEINVWLIGMHIHGMTKCGTFAMNMDCESTIFRTED